MTGHTDGRGSINGLVNRQIGGRLDGDGGVGWTSWVRISATVTSSYKLFCIFNSCCEFLTIVSLAILIGLARPK